MIDEAPDKGNTSTSAETFAALPLSRRTLAGLEGAKLFIPTAVQAQALPHALAGRDILGAAKTGSGKTLGKVIQFFTLLIFFVLMSNPFICNSLCHPFVGALVSRTMGP